MDSNRAADSEAGLMLYGFCTESLGTGARPTWSQGEAPTSRTIRRSSGEGPITQRKNSLWQAPLQADGRRRHFYGRTRLEAIQKLVDQRRQALKAGTLPHSGSRGLNDLLDAWVDAPTRIWPTLNFRPRSSLDCSPRSSISALCRFQRLCQHSRYRKAMDRRIQHLLLSEQLDCGEILVVSRGARQR